MKTDEQLIWEAYSGSWELEVVDSIDLSDGEYKGKHYGCVLEINGKKFKTKNAVRAPSFAPVKYDVFIDSGKVVVKYDQDR